ncbi:hypothetical protein KJ644_05420, partial [Candidatus Dependentiae bacterium]|nr:hypothetical protein [Candidatus Dependentiae bacterium]
MSKFKSFVFLIFLSINNIFSGLNFSSKGSKITLNNGAKFNVNNPISSWTGSLEKKSGSTILGQNIIFDNGIFEENSTENKIIGKYSPTATRKIILDGNKTFKSEAGTVSEKINVVGSGNKLQGQPIFSNTDAIRLENQNSVLNIGIQNVLNSDIELRNGRINLDSDLHMADDRVITGSGIIDLQGNSLKIGGKSSLNLTHTLDIYNGTDWNLNSKTILSGTWNVWGTQTIRGEGNILDLTSGGTIYVRNNATLNITDCVIKGLGINKGWIDFQNDAGTVNLSNVVIELEDRFYTRQGGFYVDGPTTVITKNYNWNFDTNASLTVDGLTLWLDPAAYDGTGNEGKIRFGSGTVGKYLSLVSSGTISYAARGEGLIEKIRYNSQAVVTQDKRIRYNSNAIVTHDKRIRYNSNAILFAKNEIKNNSNTIITDFRLTKQNSNAIVSQNVRINTNVTNIRTNSNAIVTQDKRIRYNSN